jgi:hypothetical protein
MDELDFVTISRPYGAERRRLANNMSFVQTDDPEN